MSNINQVINTIYTNIHIFYKYRNLVSIDESVDKAKLYSFIQNNKYFILRSVDKNENIEPAKELINSYIKGQDATIKLFYMVIVYPDSEYISKRSEFKKLMNLFTYPNRDIIIIHQEKISAHMSKYIASLNEHPNNGKIYTYSYKLFKVVVPEYCLVPKYKILSKDEIENLRKFHIEPENLSKVFENDAQMIWLGAKAGDVVRYEYLSEVTMKGIGYSFVIEN